MIFYTNVYNHKNHIYFRGVKDGKRFTQKQHFQPSLFARVSKDSKYKSLYGENLERIKFSSIFDARNYVEQYRDVKNFPIYGNTNYASQFISKVFPNNIEFDMSQIKIVTIDIETSTEFGFPDSKNAQEEILLITVRDFNSKQFTTFGSRPFLVQQDNLTYVQCNDEFDLLRKFIDFIKKDYPDVITGWNVQLFDIAYLSARLTRVLGEDALKQLSPFGKVDKFEVPFAKGRMLPAYNWCGISTLDYMDLYKKFSFKTLESYALDFVAREELEKEKIKHEYRSFKEFYTKDWKLFVEYNIYDVQLVDELEDKMRLIELILTMAYDAKCNYTEIYSPVRTWDSIIYNALLSKNVIVHNPPNVDPLTDRMIIGAFVKEPNPGKYDWVVSFDATSLYPSIMMSFNMSPETLMDGDKYLADDEKSILKLMDKSFDTSDLKNKNATMVANGQCFTKDFKGVLPQLIEYYFKMRQDVKKKMLEAESLYQKTGDVKYQKQISSYNSKQMAAKILMNSLYGACANVYFRFYDTRMAEGITMTGQYIVRYVATKLNKYLNTVCETKDIDYSFYSDTDSTYLTLGNLVQKYFNDKTIKEKVELIDKACKEAISVEIKNACDEIADYLQVYQNRIDFKREVIAESGVWLAKKRYALNVHDAEGVAYDPPKLKVQGMEIVRSSTPAYVRKVLKEAVALVLTKDEQAIKQYVADLENKWKKLPYQSIAFPRSVNGVTEYSDSTSIYRKGTPIHVRGALIYNYLIKTKDLEKQYQKILEGDKIKFLYLREPNPLGTNVITFNGEIPPEFNVTNYIDYDLMFEKTFLEPLNTLLNKVGWKIKETASLEGLFG